jgi:hypothetical protein
MTRQYLIYFLFGFLLVILPTTLIIYLSKNNERSSVLGVFIKPSPTPIPTNTPTPTPTSTPTPTPTMTPTPIPTNTPVPANTPSHQPEFTQEQIHGFIERFAGQYGVDPNILRHIATCESGFNPKASYLYYAGLYQFSSSTWRNIRNEMGEDVDVNLRYNAEESVQTAAYALSQNKGYLWPNCIP